jgi:hypothetical protein
MNSIGWLSRALAGGVALGAMTTVSSADELSALKAQLEILQSRIVRLEAPGSPALPSGAKLVTMRHGQYTSQLNLPMRAQDEVADYQGYTIAITPTADLPAPETEIRVSGEIRTRLLLYSEENNDVDDVSTDGIDLNADGDVVVNGVYDTGESLDYDDAYFNLTSRARLRVDAHTDTAVGEVGGTIRLQGTDGGTVSLNIGWGYWQMTPGVQLGGGQYDSLAAVRAGLDWNGNGALYSYTGLTNIKVPQFRLTLDAGDGLSLAASIEDNTSGGDLPAVGASVLYKQDSFFVTASAFWEDEDSSSTYADTDDNWFVGAGAGVNLGEWIHVEGAIGKGEGYDEAVYVKGLTGIENDYEFWAANAFVDFKFAEDMKLQVSYSYADMDHEYDDMTDTQFNDAVSTSQAFGAALFWDPVTELTLGVGAGHRTREDNDGTERREITSGLGAWFRF